MAATLNLSEDFSLLEAYFSGDAVTRANQLIADKVELAWDLLQSAAMPTSEYVVGGGTQVVQEYAPGTFAEWQGGARIVVNGSGLSTDAGDQDFVISGIDFLLTSSDTPDDWDNPLASISLGLGMSVSGGRATSLTLSSFAADAGDMHVAFIGPIALDDAAQTVAMPNARFEISYDSDPSEAVVLSEIYFEGALSYDGATDQVVGSFNDFGFVNEGGHYFYSTGLDITTAEIDALPEGTSATDMLRAVFEGVDDTVYTKADVELPEGFEDVVIQGDASVTVTGNTQDNRITGSTGDNVINGGEGNDTFVTQGLQDRKSVV